MTSNDANSHQFTGSPLLSVPVPRLVSPSHSQSGLPADQAVEADDEPPQTVSVASGDEELLPSHGPSVSWVSPSLEARVSKTGSGIFAVADIKAGDSLVVWTGKIVTAEEALSCMETEDKHYLLQIGDRFYQCPLSDQREPADWTNHSCNPNAGFGKNSPICLSAMRDIGVGQEILFDYGMCETNELLWPPMECECGAPCCRKFITAHDYKIPELWDKYDGFWAPHVQRLVNQLRDERDRSLRAASLVASSPIIRRPSLETDLSSPSSSSPSSSGPPSPVSKNFSPVKLSKKSVTSSRRNSRSSRRSPGKLKGKSASPSMPPPCKLDVDDDADPPHPVVGCIDRILFKWFGLVRIDRSQAASLRQLVPL